MVIGFLMDSPFFGGPERQLLELSKGLLDRAVRPVILVFAEGQTQAPFLEQLRKHGVPAVVLQENWPRARATVAEIARRVREEEIDILCTQGYKGDLLGLIAGRRAGVPVVAISRGWTTHTARVRLYESADRIALRWMNRVVCVSEGQAAKVRRVGVPPENMVVIHNAIRADRFDPSDRSGRVELEGLFPSPPRQIVGAAGRLSPEKGFDVLVEAAAQVVREAPDIGFIQFGDGRLRAAIARRIAARGLRDRFILAGFRDDLDRLFPALDLVVLPSYTEGLPNVALEAGASGVPVVATAVGGTPEVVADGVNGYLVPPGQPEVLAGRILDVLRDEPRRRDMGQKGLDRIRAGFSTAVQVEHYLEVFESVLKHPARTGLAQGQPS